jgi:dynactin-6
LSLIATTYHCALRRGNITFGNGTVVHPKATIHSLGGAEIIIGSDCIIEEMVQIVHREKGKMVIGDRNLFEAGCRESTTHCP